jgi:cation-transporting ATPase 13A3/4/5
MLVGDPLDQKLFAATGWALVDQLESAPPASRQQQQQDLAIVHPAGHPDQQLRIVRRFEFSSQLMRNLVVVQLSAPPGSSRAADGIAASAAQQSSAAATSAHPLEAGGAVADLLGGPVLDVCQAPDPGTLPPAATHMLYVKGSPEVIKELVQSSSVPPDFDAVLAEYTREGLRVLALAQGAVLPGMLPDGGVQSLTQQQLEATVPLQLVGLAVLANPLRPDSAGAIQDLQNALVSGTSCHAYAAGSALSPSRVADRGLPRTRTVLPVYCLAKAHKCAQQDSCCGCLLCCQVRTAMVTGDHVRTAISVAHHCHILPVGRPVLLVDGPGPAAAGQPAAQASLSVLYPDGSVNSRVTPSAVLAQVGVPRAVGQLLHMQGQMRAAGAAQHVIVTDRHLPLPAEAESSM